MSVHRLRHRQRPTSTPADPDQDAVDDMAAELLVLWRAMPTALERDSAGLLTGDRHAKGAAKGSPAAVNVNVIDAAARIETGLHHLAAQAVRLLREDAMRGRTVVALIAALPDWHRSLRAQRQPLAGHLRKDLGGWVFEARGAIGTRRQDRRLGPLCPDHRDTKPRPLLEVGAVAKLAGSLLAGPPTRVLLLPGPVCPRGLYVECPHPSCWWIRDRRVVDERGWPTDWLHSAAEAELVWVSVNGEPAFTWDKSNTIRCPHCKQTWTSTSERRVLARRLAELGDARPDAAALVT